MSFRATQTIQQDEYYAHEKPHPSYPKVNLLKAKNVLRATQAMNTHLRLRLYLRSLDYALVSFRCRCPVPAEIFDAGSPIRSRKSTLTRWRRRLSRQSGAEILWTSAISQ